MEVIVYFQVSGGLISIVEVMHCSVKVAPSLIASLLAEAAEIVFGDLGDLKKNWWKAEKLNRSL